MFTLRDFEEWEPGFAKMVQYYIDLNKRIGKELNNGAPYNDHQINELRIEYETTIDEYNDYVEWFFHLFGTTIIGISDSEKLEINLTKLGDLEMINI